MRLRYAPRARADIEEIFGYISQHSPKGATATVRHIRATTLMLARFPALGRQTSQPGVRVSPVPGYPFLVYHCVMRDELVILHIRHASRREPSAVELETR